MKTYRVGVIGAGQISEYHLRALKRIRNVEVLAIADQNLDAAKSVARGHNIPHVFIDSQDLLTLELDAVHILTYPDSHADLTVAALESGANVLVEKPVATSIEDCKRVIDASKRAEKMVCIDHSMLRDFFITKMLKQIHSGTIGDVIGVDYRKSQTFPTYAGGALPVHLQDGGYPYRDVGVHALYLIQEFLGTIRHVSADFQRGIDPNLFCSNWRSTVICERGTGHFYLSWDNKPHQNVVLVTGTKGLIEADLFGMTVTVRKTRPLPAFVTRIVNTIAESSHRLIQLPIHLGLVASGRIRRFHGLQELVAEFYNSIEQGSQSPVPAEDGLPIVEWTEKIARQADDAKIQYLRQFEFNPKAKVLVTGGSGFLGRRLVARLKTLHSRIRILSRNAPAQDIVDDPCIEVVIGDLGDPDAVRSAINGIEWVYHLGAAVAGSKDDFDCGTIVGTQNIVDSSIENGVKGLIHISSLSVLHAAIANTGDVVDENWPLEPRADERGHYTRTKLAAELIVSQAVEDRKLPAVILRPGQIVGRGKSPMSPAVGLKIGSHLFVLGNGQVSLPLVQIDDVVDAIIIASRETSTFDGSVYNLVDSKIVTQMDVARLVAKSGSTSLKVQRIPMPFVLAASFGIQTLAKLAGRPPPLSIYRIRSALARWTFKCDKASDDLGWTPRIGVDAGLRDSLEIAESD